MADDDAIALAHPERDCPACGKPNRAGQVRCVICGTELAGETSVPAPPPPPPRPAVPAPMSADPAWELPPAPSAAAVRAAATPRRRVRHESPWLWPAAAGGLIVTVGALFWLSTILTPSTDEVLLAPPAQPPPYRLATKVPAPAAAVPPAYAPAARPVEPPAAVPAPAARPEDAARAREAPAAAPAAIAAPRAAADAPSRRAPVPGGGEPVRETTRQATGRGARERPGRESRPAAPEAPRAPSAEAAYAAVPEPPPAVVTPPADRPADGAPPPVTERAYRAAVDVHNRRVDEYNAIVAEMHQRNAWDDPEQFAELHQRLDRARAAVESARTRAEGIRAQLDARRARSR